MTVQEQYVLLEKTVRSYNPAADFDHIRAAFEYADHCHEGQKRKSGEPYIIHPLAVAQIVAEELKLDSESIEAALLHDVIEDTPATHADVARMFSPTIANLVEGVSKLTRIQYATKEDEQMENLRKMLMAMSKDIRVILIKVSDRLHNMRTMEYQSPEKQKQKSLETMEIYAPISHRLGMQRIKWELEDLSLKYLDPVGYNEIITRLDAKKPEYDAFLLRTQTQMDDRLTELGIQHMVYGRIKHPYSIYRKMFNQNKSLDEIFDLFAFRVLVDTVGDCYNVLGVVHDIYKPIPGRFKDYIGTEKPNGYQSLHTTVMGPDGLPFEVQIRTWKMHEIAEYGVAAHWKYKQHGQGAGTEGKYEWVRRLLENQEGADAEEYIHSLKVDMFADEVFVFTPNGDVQNLPAGATPIDFAYAIHSAVGNSMVGAKVNNRIVTFDHILKNGDIVEIMTAKSAKGPSRDWMKIAKSSEARSKIRQWFKKEKREENIANGRSSFEQELKHMGLSMRDVTDPENLPHLLKKVAYGTLEEMYAAIGYGGFTAQKAVSRMKGELLRIARQHQAEELTLKPEEPPIPVPQRPVGKSEQGIIVEGLDNCLVKFSRCCTPVPGDEIVGFITRGYGVSVHRADCPNAAPERRTGQEGRWLKVSWGKDTNESYPTTIDVMSKDRMGLILDISTALSSTNTFVSGLNSRSTEDGFAVIRLEIRVRDGAQMKAIMNKLNQISGVLQVTRPAG
ncbi:bifunctional (p)ppGpp synthetase/guanosine-3',5'-bis(diphosphate) 3'-pyrophosphohydrolase [uncultured Oscillibacter sp.]|jgi:guanosine-3',5'-bis(diphosphate) 3'-pyrophosphohydrolase|uniref:RelA/SpoT family protein n=1 Tax=uncultured Oscillibacter sp. TaxID=876091 RepID=UPI002171F915|nr:bifunctional (p)ppGpp synthetase/guanosine-3',5'-bis(diphosphate) 3'-pyrophosphohydrolase [uncultured Oscillibacter sp.]MCI9554962.1 bifunctional (p)ppGpp synthetase/guanosine-3',5'-bis(diphosphate) 3'-pyrophosphohydrolase [Oscillibacter sp.]